MLAGRQVAAVHWAETASTDVLRIRDLASGKERVLGKIVVGGSAAWSEDSRDVLTAAASGIGSEITAHPINGAAPYHVYAATINVSHLAAGAGGLLALETDPSRQNLARASATPAAQPDIIDPANGKSWSPSFAPDGTLAFLSNRSGTNAIWVIKPGSAPALLYDGGLSPLFRLEFSPDGTSRHADRGRRGPDRHHPDGGRRHRVVLSFSDLRRRRADLDAGQPGSDLFRQAGADYIRVDITNPARRRVAAPLLWGAIIYHGGHEYAQRVETAGILGDRWQAAPGDRQIPSALGSATSAFG